MDNATWTNDVAEQIAGARRDAAQRSLVAGNALEVTGRIVAIGAIVVLLLVLWADMPQQPVLTILAATTGLSLSLVGTVIASHARGVLAALDDADLLALPRDLS